MKLLIPRTIAVLLCFSVSIHTAVAGPFHTKIITATSDPLVLVIAENVFLQVRNFTQEGGSARGTITAVIDGEAVNMLTASQINSTSLAVAPEIINRIVVAGPATVTVNPVPGATLTITYRKVREGAPEAVPTPTATPVPTATPTATPTPTP